MRLSFIPAVKPNDTVGVCVTQDAVRFLHVRSTPYKREITSIQEAHIAGMKDSEASSALRLAWEGLRVKPGRIVAVMSAQEIITKNIEIPSNDPGEIREIINLQAGRHTPYSREEIVADYINIGAFKNNYSKILLVIAARALIKQHVDLLERAGIRVSRVLYAAEALAQTSSRLCKADPNATAPTIIADVDEHHTNCVIAHRGKALFVRTLPLGAAEVFGEPEAYFPRFCEELKKSFEAYQNEDIDKRPVTLIVTGAAQQKDDMVSALEERLAVNVRIVPYVHSLQVSPEAQKHLAEHPRSSYLALAAAVYAGNDLLVDFTPDEIRMRRAFEQRGRDLMKTGIFVLVLFVLVSSLVILRFYFKTAYLAAVQARSEELSLQVKELDADVHKISFVKGYLRRRGQALDVLTELYAVAPQDLQLSDIRFETDKFTARGTADSMSTVFSFAENLERSKLFREVKTKNTSKRRENDKDVTDFEIGSLTEERRP